MHGVRSRTGTRPAQDATQKHAHRPLLPLTVYRDGRAELEQAELRRRKRHHRRRPRLGRVRSPAAAAGAHAAPRPCQGGAGAGGPPRLHRQPGQRKAAWERAKQHGWWCGGRRRGGGGSNTEATLYWSRTRLRVARTLTTHGAGAVVWDPAQSVGARGCSGSKTVRRRVWVCGVCCDLLPACGGFPQYWFGKVVSSTRYELPCKRKHNSRTYLPPLQHHVVDRGCATRQERRRNGAGEVQVRTPGSDTARARANSLASADC